MLSELKQTLQRLHNDAEQFGDKFHKSICTLIYLVAFAALLHSSFTGKWCPALAATPIELANSGDLLEAPVSA